MLAAHTTGAESVSCGKGTVGFIDIHITLRGRAAQAHQRSAAIAMDDLIMSSQPKYMEQYQRMKRSYALFDAIDQGRVHDRPSESYDDEVYTFFLNCYHLKDWIKNDVGAGVIAQTGVEQFIDSSRPLKLCADICNAHKHLQLNRSRNNENPQFATKHMLFSLGILSQRL